VRLTEPTGQVGELDAAGGRASPTSDRPARTTPFPGQVRALLGRLADNLARNPFRFGVALVIVGIVLSLAGPIWYSFSAWRHLSAAEHLALANRNGATLVASLPSLRRELVQGNADLGQARNQLRLLDPVFRLIGRVPMVRGASEVPTLLDLSVALTTTAADVATAATPDSPSSADDWRRTLVAALGAHADELGRVQADAALVTTTRSQIRRGNLIGPFAPVGRLLDRADPYIAASTDGSAALQIAPALLGAQRPVSYVLMGQNEDERRATGGFLGSLGVVTIDRGDVSSIDIKNSYDFAPSDKNPLPPPPPLAEYLGFGGWYVRDANWFPDFPTSAAWIEWFWNYYYGQEPNGVIAFDQTAIEQLLTVTGPIDLPDLHETITAANYRERSLYWVYQAGSTSDDPQWVRGAKTSFAHELGTALFKKLLAAPPTDYARYAPVVASLVAQKHLQVALRDPTAAGLLAKEGWDGHLDRAAPDYLLASDTTATYTKLAPYVQKAIQETIAVQPDGSEHVAVTVSYRNEFRPELAGKTYPAGYLGEYWNPVSQELEYQTGRYATYVRAYVPAGAANVVMQGSDQPSTTTSESGRLVVDGYVAIPMGTSRSLELGYDLPAGSWVAHSPHVVLVQKEPGTQAVPLTVSIVAPSGYSLSDGPATQPRLSWTGDLREDWQRTVTLIRS
jgi:hypothetical protein